MMDGAMGAWVLADTVFGGTGLALLLGILVGTGIAMLFIGLQRFVDGHSNNALRHLDQVVNFSVPAATARPQRGLGALFGGRRARRSPYAAFAESASSRSFTVTLARDLARADLKITVGEFMVLSVVAASAGALLGFALPLGGHVLLALLLFAAGLYGPRIIVNRQKNKRQAAFNGQLADIITLMSGALRAGYSLLQAMELVAREGPEPVSNEFDRVVREVGLGLSPEEALANLVERMQSEDLELFVTAINVQREVGGNLVEVMETIAHTIRERVKLIGEMGVLTAQQQLSGYVIALLPIVLALLLAVINPTYMLGVFKQTVWCGWTMLSCSVVMIFSGFLVIRRIVNIKI